MHSSSARSTGPLMQQRECRSWLPRLPVANDTELPPGPVTLTLLPQARFLEGNRNGRWPRHPRHISQRVSRFQLSEG